MIGELRAEVHAAIAAHREFVQGLLVELVAGIRDDVALDLRKLREETERAAPKSAGRLDGLDGRGLDGLDRLTVGRRRPLRSSPSTVLVSGGAERPYATSWPPVS